MDDLVGYFFPNDQFTALSMLMLMVAIIGSMHYCVKSLLTIYASLPILPFVNSTRGTEMNYEAACIAIHKPEYFTPPEVFAASEFVLSVRKFPRTVAEAFPPHIAAEAHEENRKRAIAARATAFNMLAEGN
jgi:hypothetical protein